MWYVSGVLYAVLYVHVSCFVVRGCAVSRRYINVCNCDMFGVVNVYLDHLNFCVVYPKYITSQQCMPIGCTRQEVGSLHSLETTLHSLQQTYLRPSIHTTQNPEWSRYTLTTLNIQKRDDRTPTTTRVKGVGRQQQLHEFVFDSVYVDLQYDEIYPTSTAGSVSLRCVCSHVVVFGLSVRLSWYPMLMR